MDSNMIASSSMAPGVNVKMVCRNVKTGEVTRTIEQHNRFLKTGIMGLIRFLNGEFNNSTPQHIAEYIPRYLALGSNQAETTDTGGVTTEVTVNDTRLLNELNLPRTRLIQRNIITNRYNDPYIKLTIKHYIPVSAYVGESIAEAGLFTNLTGNNAIARITFDRFIKDAETVIDVTWEITIVSIESENESYVEIDKQDLVSSIYNAFLGIGRKYPGISSLMSALRTGVSDYGRKDVSQKEVDRITQKIQELSYPLDKFDYITEPVRIPIGSVIKYNVDKNPKIIENNGIYPCGQYLEINDNAFDRFGIFSNDGVRTVIGFARINILTGLYEYSNVLYDTTTGWEGVNPSGIQAADEKLSKTTTGQFINSGNITVLNWNWGEDWLILSASGEVDPDIPLPDEIPNGEEILY